MPVNHDRGRSRLHGNSPGHLWGAAGQDQREHGLPLYRVQTGMGITDHGPWT